MEKICAGINVTKNAKISIILCCLSMLFLGGCATTVPFVYQYPSINATTSPNLNMAYTSIKDERADSSIDKVFANKPTEEVNKVIEEELRSTGLFNVVPMPPNKSDNEKLKESNLDFVMNPVLLELRWEVPNYERILQTAFATGFLTGGIGGLIYGSTETDVYGITKLKIALTEQKSGETVLEKEYMGRAEEKMKKLQCDTPKTKADMVGKSLKLAMEQFKVDLIETVKPMNNETASGIRQTEIKVQTAASDGK